MRGTRRKFQVGRMSTTSTTADPSQNLGGPSKTRPQDRLHHPEALAQASASSDLFFCISNARRVVQIDRQFNGPRFAATTKRTSGCENVRHTSCWNPKRGLRKLRNGRQRWNLFWRVCAVWRRSGSRQSSRRVETSQGGDGGFACKGFCPAAHLTELDAKWGVVNATFRKPHKRLDAVKKQFASAPPLLLTRSRSFVSCGRRQRS